MSSPLQGAHTYSQVHRIFRTCIAYNDPGFAGVELVGVVFRQGSFIEKTVGIGRRSSRHFDTIRSQAALVRCYHGCLWLMSTNPGNLSVPTLVCPPFPVSTYSDPSTIGHSSYLLFGPSAWLPLTRASLGIPTNSMLPGIALTLRRFSL